MGKLSDSQLINYRSFDCGINADLLQEHYNIYGALYLNPSSAPILVVNKKARFTLCPWG